MNYQPDPQAQAFLKLIVERYRPDKAALFLKTTDWHAAALHEIPPDELWNRKHLSLGAIEDTIKEKEGRVVLDSTHEPDPTNFLSFIASTMMAALTIYTEKEAPMVIALTRALENGVYKMEDREPLEEFVNSQSWQ